MACNGNDCRLRRKQGVAVGAAASRMRVLLKARSIRWVPQPVLVSEEKATVTPSGFPHQHRRLFNQGIGAAQALECAADAVLAKAVQQRRQPDGQVFCTRRAGTPPPLSPPASASDESSGRITSSIFLSRYAAGAGALSSFASSSSMRSTDTQSRWAHSSCAACAVGGSMAKPNRAAKRYSRRMRSASSVNRWRGTPTARTMPLCRSACPPKGSTRPSFFIVGHGVDGKIPPGQVLPHIRHKVHLVRVAAICVGAFCTEGGDLVKGTALLHRYRAVLQAGGDAPLRAEQLHHLLRQSTGAQVPVVRCKAQQTVPHAAAHHVGCIARPVQGVQQLCRTLVHPDGHGCASSYCRVMLFAVKAALRRREDALCLRGILLRVGDHGGIMGQPKPLCPRLRGKGCALLKGAVPPLTGLVPPPPEGIGGGASHGMRHPCPPRTLKAGGRPAQKYHLNPLRGAPSTCAGCTVLPSTATLCPFCSNFHCCTGTPSARACSGENLPARGSSSR